MRLASTDPAEARSRIAGLLAFVLALIPAVLAIWSVRWFVTQDGPAHLYNAHVLAESLKPDSPFRDVYTVRWEPLPNWAGHLALMGLVEALPPYTADRAMSTIVLVGFAASAAWLRRRVAGWRGMALAGPLAVMLALNATWLLGFTSFLLGACLFPITLGVWWDGRDRFGPGRAAAVAALVGLGYFCHPVSLGLTAAGLVVLAAITPGLDRHARWGWTLLGLLPLVPLGLIYRRLMQGGGALQPTWGHLDGSVRSWGNQLGWVDPISLAGKMHLPFVDRPSRWFALTTPVLWLLVALAAFLISTVRGRPPRSSIGWAALAALLTIGGVAGPDTFGPSHGNYMPQRVVLLGLVALTPFLDLDTKRWGCRLGGAALIFSLAVQSAFVWEYARTADRVAGDFMRVKPQVGQGRRIATLLVGIKGRFRSNPLLHVDSLLGIGAGNIVWSNYETAHYYFPVQFRPEVPRPPAREFEEIALLDEPGEEAERASRWRRLIERHRDEVDVLLVWGTDPGLDAFNSRWFEPVATEGPVRVYRRRGSR